ncbi:MAG: regulatory protein RecX, partial [Sediminibacterium sp.]|nr:regulatory protein RecX [Sediminibacterium sp.]
WGKAKIIYALRQKKVSEQNIKRSLREITEEDYLGSLEKLADTKWKSLKGEQYLSREAKTNAYLLQKGYERPAIQKVMAKLKSGNKE